MTSGIRLAAVALLLAPYGIFASLCPPVKPNRCAETRACHDS
jgi:hypothetical protein